MTQLLAIAPTDYDNTCYTLGAFLSEYLNQSRPGSVERFEDFDSQDWQPADFPLLKVFKVRWSGIAGDIAQVRIYYIAKPAENANGVDFNWVVKSIFRLLDLFNEAEPCVQIDLSSIAARYQVLAKETVFPFVQFDFELQER